MPRINSYNNTTNNYQLDPLFANETENTVQNQLYHLIELTLPEGEQPFKIVDANHDVVYDSGGVAWNGNVNTKGSYTYSMFPVKFSPADINSDGSISKASIAIANVSREVMYYVEKYGGLRGCRVSIRTVYANALYYTYTYNADGSVVETVNPDSDYNISAGMQDEFFIDNYTANETTVTFQLDPIIDLEIRIPRRRYMVDSCYFLYKDPETCGYTGADPVVGGVTQLNCIKTLAACKLRGNQRYFGGFPGISGSRRIFL